MNPMYDFHGQVAIVTGARAGMGRVPPPRSRPPAPRSCSPTSTSTPYDAVEDDRGGQRVLAVACDVADEDQVADMVAGPSTTFGRLDMAFNNAGIRPRRPTPPTNRRSCSIASTPSTCVACGPA